MYKILVAPIIAFAVFILRKLLPRLDKDNKTVKEYEERQL